MARARLVRRLRAIGGQSSTLRRSRTTRRTAGDGSPPILSGDSRRHRAGREVAGDVPDQAAGRRAERHGEPDQGEGCGAAWAES
jgi:hypothetical protein